MCELRATRLNAHRFPLKSLMTLSSRRSFALRSSRWRPRSGWQNRAIASGSRVIVAPVIAMSYLPVATAGEDAGERQDFMADLKGRVLLLARRPFHCQSLWACRP